MAKLPSTDHHWLTHPWWTFSLWSVLDPLLDFPNLTWRVRDANSIKLLVSALKWLCHHTLHHLEYIIWITLIYDMCTICLGGFAIDIRVHGWPWQLWYIKNTPPKHPGQTCHIRAIRQQHHRTWSLAEDCTVLKKGKFKKKCTRTA